MTTPLFYNFNNLPYWNNGGGLLDDPANGTSFASSGGEIAPYSQQFEAGYDSRWGRLSVARRQRALNYSNANLCDGQFKFPLFLNRVAIDFALSGTYGQSQLTRDFYPHNMVLPAFVLQGQCYDQASYGELCEFVHAQQQRGIRGSGGSGLGTLATYQGKQYRLPLIQLYIQGNIYPHAHGTNGGASRGGLNVTFNGQKKPNQMNKGQHEDILCLGYIMSMPRQHQQGDYAPKYTFQFMISNMLHGPYQDGIGTTVSQSTWLALLKGTDAQKYGTKADLAFNEQALKFAGQNANLQAMSSGG